MVAAEHGQTDIVGLLLQAGSPHNVQVMWAYAIDRILWWSIYPFQWLFTEAIEGMIRVWSPGYVWRISVVQN